VAPVHICLCIRSQTFMFSFSIFGYILFNGCETVLMSRQVQRNKVVDKAVEFHVKMMQRKMAQQETHKPWIYKH